ncbi:group II trans-sialidase superfamily [Trypanosoma conorhini]|uniref:Group II trans-sialidase superfamily n=1 Tax=Trypanosoma conorhini TaxID=83891 RepID=A0A422NRQ6_9TRYP|nr:group II trans-sialidase superfamily [Trypanosoma conorhini]RNF08160.1 group II trans-sialidase superfamily [Trypanosoma conorhini]
MITALLQERGNRTTRRLFLSPLTEELGTITSVLGTWAKLDSAFSKSSVPTAGLVGFLSDASSDATWDDAYRCLNAVVKNAKKFDNGFEFTGPESGGMWPVNMWDYGNVYGFVNYAFTLVATVTIQQAPKESAPLLGASLEGYGSTKFVGLACTAKSGRRSSTARQPHPTAIGSRGRSTKWRSCCRATRAPCTWTASSWGAPTRRQHPRHGVTKSHTSTLSSALSSLALSGRLYKSKFVTVTPPPLSVPSPSSSPKKITRKAKQTTASRARVCIGCCYSCCCWDYGALRPSPE